MNYNIIYTDSSYEDLFYFADYIERMTFSKEKADSEIIFILQEIAKLTLFPKMYQIIYKEFRSFSVKNMRIFYKIYEDKKEIVIFRILNHSKDYINILN